MDLKLATRLSTLALATALPAAAHAQSTPLYLVTTPTVLTTPSGYGGPNGNLATDKFGNLYVPDAAGSIVLEYPANGGPSIVIFDATKTSPQVSGVAVDAANNLYVTTRYDSSLSATETDIFKFPYSSNGYPGAYVYTGAAPPACTAASTGVCAYGNYLQTTGYYYQPQAIAFDASGNGYMITTYDSLNKAGGLSIYACDVQCGYDNDSATLAVAKLPTQALSLAAASNGDLYWADGTDVYYSAAGSGKATLFDTSYESVYGGASGVGFDRAGNLYVTNSGGTYEVPLIGGSIKATNKFQVAQSSYGGYTGPAVDNNGNVYSSAYSTLLKSSLYNYNFGSVAVGSTVAAQTFTITFLSAGTITSIVAQQSGVPSTEFTFLPGTCTPAAAFPAGGTCTFTVGFAPASVGVRRATITMTDTSNNRVSTYVTGVGLGTGVSVDPGTPTAVTTTLTAPSGLAVDNAGNLFVADATAKAVYEYKGGSGSPVTLGSGYTRPTGVATDGAGNVYVVDQGAGTLQEILNTGGSFAATSTVLATGLNSPTDVIVSGAGSIYVSNTGANTVLQYANSSRIGSLSAALGLGVGLSRPTGLALDPSGNLYVADTGNNRAVQLAYTGAQTAFGTGLSAPTGVAAEPSGAVVIADQGNGRVVRVPSEAGVLNSAHQVSLSQPVLNPFAVRLGVGGNLYISDNTVGAVDLLQRTAGTLNFGISNVNTSTTPQTIVVSSTGTANLTLNSPFFTAPPANSGFTLTSGAGSQGCSAGTLATGTDCTLSSVFTPTAKTTYSYLASLNTLAANAPTPSITLTGQGVQLVAVNVTLAQTSPTGGVTYGVPVTLTATIASASGSSTTTPTGTVTFNVDGSNTKPVTLSNGTASITLTGLGGTTNHSVIATYNGGAVYASGSSTAYQFTVQPATVTPVETFFTDSSMPPSSAVGNAVSFSIAITPSVYVSGGLNGVVNFYNGSTLLGSGAITQQAGAGGTVTYSAGFSTATLAPSCLTGETLPKCSNIYQISASYAGNGNYSGFSLPAVAVIVTNPTYSLVASNSTINSTAGQPGTATLTVTSYSAYQGAVALSCSGLPANAYCIFRPGLISLTPVQTTPPSPANPNGVYSIPPQVTTMQVLVSEDPTTVKSLSSFTLLGLLSALGMFFVGTRRKGRNLRGLAACCLMGIVTAVSMGSLSACSSGMSSAAYPTPTGTYPLTLTATSSPLNGGQPPTAYNITSMSSTAGAVTLTTAGPYATGYSATQLVTITGVTPTVFNGTFTLTSSTSLPGPVVNNVQTYYSQLTYNLPTATTATGSGGIVRVGNITYTYPFTLVVK
jgi:sugar lactone lactonase YvrE